MSTKQLFWGTFLAGLLAATSARAGDETGQVGKAPRNSGVQSAAPVVQRRAVLPAGWFQQQGGTPATLTGTSASGVRPVVHYDTLGPAAGKEEANAVPGVARRLRQLRKATTLPAAPAEAATATAPGAIPAPNAAAEAVGPGNGAVNTAASGGGAGVDATGGSSRRRVDVANLPLNSPSLGALPNAAVEATALPVNGVPTAEDAGPLFAPGVNLPDVTQEPSAQVVTQPINSTEPNASPSVESNPRSTDVVEPKAIENSPQAAATEATVAADAATVPAEAADGEMRPEGEAEQGHVSEGVVEESSKSPEDHALPSVMQRPSADSTVDSPDESNGGEVATEKMASRRSSRSNENSKLDLSSAPSAKQESNETSSMAIQEERQSQEPVAVGEDDAVILSEEAPVISVKTLGPKTIVVGKLSKYVIHVQNRGEGAAKDLVVRMNIPPWIEVADQSATVGAARIQPDDSGQSSLAWNLGNLSPNGQEKLTLGLIPRSSRPVDLGVTWTFAPAASSTLIQVQEPKLHMNVVGPQDVLFGETKVYTLTVSNPGTGDAENVVLSLLPLVPGEKSAGVRPMGTIPAGGRRTVEVELTARQTGRLQVRAEAMADGGLTARGEQDVLVRRASLEVVAEGAPRKYAGTRARYVVRVTNSGDATASDSLVVATLPAGAQTVASSDGGVFSPQNGQVQWTLGELRPGASRVLELECTLISPGDNRLDVRTAAAGDLSALASVTTHVEALADLKMTVNDPQGAVAIGADVTYEVRIVNRGTKAAESIDVYGYFSEGVEPISVTGWRGTVGEGEVVLQSIPRLAPGQEMLVRITAQASRAGDHVFRAELECQDPETKLAVEEWTRFYGEDASDEPPAREADRRSSAPPQRKRH